MCGFTGIWQAPNSATETLRNQVEAMSARLQHRGPDDSGHWIDAREGLALGHRRLAIQDLSPAGRQPMCLGSGRYVLVYNGEIYNAPALRIELEEGGNAPIWKGHSDTEVLLATVEAWGLETAVSRFNGMFAFAIWDRQERTLHLVRDRLGIKPLYFGFSRGTFLFGSELKALQAHQDFDAKIDRDALALFFRHNDIPAPHTIFHGIRKLHPGTILTLSGSDAEPQFNTYWDAWQVAETGSISRFAGSYTEAVEELESLLHDAVGIRLLSDVPLGAFLSGGIDSSTVVALMQTQCERPVRSFSIGFSEIGYNEAQHAKAVAKHLGTDHSELYVTPQQAQAVIPKLPTIYDEPFADSSQIPTFLVSQLARGNVTVSLSGDGGDELFSGYNRYIWGARTWCNIARIPTALRSLAGSMLTLLSEKQWNTIYSYGERMVPARFQMQSPGRNMHRLATLLNVTNERELYRGLVTHWEQPDKLVLGSREPLSRLTQSRQPNLPSFTEWMMAQDQVTYLPEDILTKVDRASMAVSLEARVPLLDHRVVEFAWSLPLEWKLQGVTGKRILRDVLYRHVPQGLIERPKMGFGVPIDSWLRGPLRDWAETLLNASRIKQEGYLNPKLIRKKWQEHLSGQSNCQYLIWDVLMFQSWLETQTI